MQFQAMPDPTSEALARFASSFPRDKIAPTTLHRFREEGLRFSLQVTEKAILDLERSSSRFPALCDWIKALERNAAHVDSGLGSSLHPAPEDYAKLTPKQRQMIAHANDVLWAADFERRQAARPPNLRGLNVAAEMLAHGIRISANGEKIAYDAKKILNPDFDCEFGKQSVAAHSGPPERMFSESTREWTAES